MSAPGHPTERLVDLVDGRLAAAEAAAIEQHLAGCAECRREVAWLKAWHTAAGVARDGAAAPADLRARIAAALDEVDRAQALAKAPAAASGRRGWLWAGLAAAAMLLLYLAGPWRPTAVDAVEVARRDFAAVQSGAVALAEQTNDPTALERYFAAAPGPRVRVIDLAMMGWTLEGGASRPFAGQPSALYAYRAADGRHLVCQMYEGQLAALPPADAVQRQNGFEFRVYTRDGVTLVFWQEGELVCVLASDLPAAEVVALATAKAMAPA
ncbi:MAG: anti-sigma factor [Vicinamibacterales bacterium]